LFFGFFCLFFFVSIFTPPPDQAFTNTHDPPACIMSISLLPNRFKNRTVIVRRISGVSHGFFSFSARPVSLLYGSQGRGSLAPGPFFGTSPLSLGGFSLVMDAACHLLLPPFRFLAQHSPPTAAMFRLSSGGGFYWSSFLPTLCHFFYFQLMLPLLFFFFVVDLLTDMVSLFFQASRTPEPKYQPVIFGPLAAVFVRCGPSLKAGVFDSLPHAIHALTPKFKDHFAVHRPLRATATLTLWKTDSLFAQLPNSSHHPEFNPFLSFVVARFIR